MNRLVRVAKCIATLLLIASFFMPLSRCSSVQNPPENADGTSVTHADGSPIEREYFDVRGYDLVTDKDGPIWTLVFFWPVFFQLAALISPSKSNMKSVIAIETLLLAFSAYYVGILIYNLADLRYGAYVFYIAILIYAAGLIAQYRVATPNNSFKRTAAPKFE